MDNERYLHDLRDIAHDISWESVIRYFGLLVARKTLSGKLYLSCVFHNERTPSLVFLPKIRKFRCYGCGMHGDVADFVAEYKFGKTLLEYHFSLHLQGDRDFMGEIANVLKVLSRM